MCTYLQWFPIWCHVYLRDKSNNVDKIGKEACSTDVRSMFQRRN